MRGVAEQVTFDQDVSHRRGFLLLESGVHQQSDRELTQFFDGKSGGHARQIWAVLTLSASRASGLLRAARKIRALQHHLG